MEEKMNGGPQNWREFRLLMAKVLKEVGMDRQAYLAGYLDLEDGQIVPLARAWQNRAAEPEEEWELVADCEVHDLVIEWGGTRAQAEAAAMLAKA